MADVDSVVYTTTERKVRKVKKTTKRRESHDQNASEVTITEVDSTQNNHHAIEEYVLADDIIRQTHFIILSSFLLLLMAVRRHCDYHIDPNPLRIGSRERIFLKISR